MARLKTVHVRMGDTIQGLAAREIGDPAAWRELATLNSLRAPYLYPSADEADRRAGVLLWGDPINVPARAITDNAVVGDGALGRDVRLAYGALVAVDGDLATVEGAANLGQALRHRVLTTYGSYMPHPTYGCELKTLLGLRNDPTRMLLAAGLSRRAMLRDPRTSSVKTSAVAKGDVLAVDARVVPVGSDTPFDTNAVFQLPST